MEKHELGVILAKFFFSLLFIKQKMLIISK